MLHNIAYVLGVGVRRRLRRQLNQFLKLTDDCQATQSATLHRLLRLNSDADFSRIHRLDLVDTAREYRAAVPLQDYASLAPFVERLKRGDSSALLGPSNPLLMFALTSGTTSDTKYIPVTAPFLADYRRGWQCWGIAAFDAHPRLKRLKVFQLTSDYDRCRTVAGIPCGNISGLAQHVQNSLVRALYSVPEATRKISDASARYYVALRYGVADPAIGLCTTANPSTLLYLARLMQHESERLIRDLRNGTATPPEADALQGLESPLRLRRHKARARQLDKIAEREGKLTPRHVWPNLQLLSVWTGGSAAAYLPELREEYGPIPIRDHGLSASEGRMTIPLEDEANDGILDIQSHYFEFIHEAEVDAPHPRVYEAHELEQGERYFIILTTASGFYRYNISDVVECTGFQGTTPRLAFLHKGAHISSVTGEKLSESQVVAAVGNMQQALSRSLGPFALTPVWGDPPRYRLLFEMSEEDFTHEQMLRLAESVDQELQSLNSEYSDKRSSQRLGRIEPHVVPAGSWARFAADRQTGVGGSAEQYKHPFLVPRLEFAEEFVRTYGRASEEISVS